MLFDCLQVFKMVLQKWKVVQRWILFRFYQNEYCQIFCFLKFLKIDLKLQNFAVIEVKHTGIHYIIDSLLEMWISF